MTMSVVPNADGSYTIECNGVKIKVGIQQPTDSTPAPIGDTPPPPKPPKPWPRVPRPNRGGVTAYLQLEVATDDRLLMREISADEVQAILARAAPEARIDVRRDGDRSLTAELRLPAGQALEIPLLQNAVEELRQGFGAVDIYIRVAPNQLGDAYIRVETGAS